MSDRQLTRTTFSTSRLLDFASIKELTAQTGHEVGEWPLVIVKELFDNALDATEEAGVAPVISVQVDASGITVRDNGPGLPATTVRSILDFSTRTSSREAYVSPTRGAQGNALKTILAMPFVLDGERGQIEIAAQGERHRIAFTVDRIRQEPVPAHEVEPDGCKSGTEIRVRWPDCACSILTDAEARFLQIADDFTWLNPSLTLDVSWFGRRFSVPATQSTWEKWKPSDPTSPHWYDPECFERLVAAYLAHDADTGRVRTVREFISEFRGLSGSAKGKAVLAKVGLSREPLNRLVVDGRVDPVLSRQLLDAMQASSTPVKPALLGTIGREHLKARFEAAGCEMESFDYRRIADCDDDGIPFVLETAFGWLGDEAEDERRLVTGVNWSPGIRNPFRSLGAFGMSLDTILSRQRVDQDEPVIFVLHAAYPRVEYLDRGKSSVVVRS
jgi:DNA topoisomerase VI subunit B